jgi:hypothetical protein
MLAGIAKKKNYWVWECSAFRWKEKNPKPSSQEKY